MAKSNGFLAPDFKMEPYWWTAAPRPLDTPGAMPEKADVAIIGSGFTGLACALALARAGRAGHPGSGRCRGHALLLYICHSLFKASQNPNVQFPDLLAQGISVEPK